jgi:hypothetical protein
MSPFVAYYNNILSSANMELLQYSSLFYLVHYSVLSEFENVLSQWYYTVDYSE